MNEREKIIRLWFDMWIKKADLGIDNIGSIRSLLGYDWINYVLITII